MCARDKTIINDDHIVEPTTSGFEPSWPAELKIDLLMPALLNRASGVIISIKMHKRSVHKFMTFVNESAATMPVGVVAACENLMFNLDNLLCDLKSSNESNHEDVIHFCELILHLIDETASIYRDIKKIA